MAEAIETRKRLNPDFAWRLAQRVRYVDPKDIGPIPVHVPGLLERLMKKTEEDYE